MRNRIPDTTWTAVFEILPDLHLEIEDMFNALSRGVEY